MPIRGRRETIAVELTPNLVEVGPKVAQIGPTLATEVDDAPSASLDPTLQNTHLCPPIRNDY